MLHTKNLQLTIGNKTLFQHLNLSYNPGEFWCFVGPNGSGKTTLLHTLSGLNKPATGTIYLHNAPLEQYSYRKRAQQLGLLLQHNEQLAYFTVLEALLAARHPHQKSWQSFKQQDSALIDQVLNLLDLTAHQNQRIANLSGGEKQRLQIAMLITQNPKIYLLDEPTNHLDLTYQVKVMKLLRQLAVEKKKLVVAAAHDLNLVSQFATHVCLFFPDNTLKAGKIEKIFTANNLSLLYNQRLVKIESGPHQLWVCEPEQGSLL